MSAADEDAWVQTLLDALTADEFDTCPVYFRLPLISSTLLNMCLAGLHAKGIHTTYNREQETLYVVHPLSAPISPVATHPLIDAFDIQDHVRAYNTWREVRLDYIRRGVDAVLDKYAKQEVGGMYGAVFAIPHTLCSDVLIWQDLVALYEILPARQYYMWNSGKDCNDVYTAVVRFSLDSEQALQFTLEFTIT